MIASPLAKGLFHRAIMQRGPGALASIGVRGSLMQSQEELEAIGVRFAEQMGVSSLAEMRALPVEKLTTREPDEPPIEFRPVIDGWFMPADPDEINTHRQYTDVPLMTGLMADEASAFLAYGRQTAVEFKKAAGDRFGERAAAYLALYPAGSDEEAKASQIESAREIGLISLADLLRKRAKTSETPVFAYYFERAIPWPDHPEYGAFHTGEIPYVFNNLALLDRPWEPLDRVLADQVSSYWVNFTEKGNPNGEELPAWPEFDKKEGRFIRLGADPAPMQLPTEEKQAFFLDR
jgi:para-nitrobenzyl esterase